MDGSKIKHTSQGTRLVVLWIVTTLSTVLAAPMYIEPSDLELRKQLLHYDKEHESYYLAPSNGGTLLTLAEINATYPQYVDITIEEGVGDPQCPNKPPNGLIDPAQRNSTCPWHFVINKDINRYPEEMWEANCTCVHCLEFLNGTQTVNRCKSVYYYTRVLRRIGVLASTNEYEYKEALEPLRTGCMCTSESTYPSGGKPTDDPPMPGTK